MKEFEKYYKEANGLYYLDINPRKEQAIIFLHGLGLNSYSWEYQIEFFKRKNYRIIIPDFPGFGRSRTIAETTVKSISHSIYKLIECLKLKSIYAVGVSGGGCVLLQMLLDHPKLISKCVICNSFARIWYNSICIELHTKFRYMLSKVLPLKWQARFVAKNLCVKKQNEDEFFHQMSSANFFSYRDFLTSLMHFNVYNQLGKITKPDVLIMTGREDTTVPPYIQAELSNIPNSRHIFIGGNHAMTVNNYEEVNKEIAKFFVNDWF